jgi:hypothetical protein
MEDRLSQQEIEHDLKIPGYNKVSGGKRTARQTDQGTEAARPILLEDPEKEKHEG